MSLRPIKQNPDVDLLRARTEKALRNQVGTAFDHRVKTTAGKTGQPVEFEQADRAFLEQVRTELSSGRKPQDIIVRRDVARSEEPAAVYVTNPYDYPVLLRLALERCYASSTADKALIHSRVEALSARLQRIAEHEWEHGVPALSAGGTMRYCVWFNELDGRVGFTPFVTPDTDLPLPVHLDIAGAVADPSPTDSAVLTELRQLVARFTDGFA